ncbi:MAG TPA: hypothetical protein VJQ43_06785 [Thermoplasmata archaeon]|nr:hypothetical protein [Thermoplasmata archaeon]
MSITIFEVPTLKRTELDAALRDDLVSRQSQKIRDAPSAGGPAGQLFVVVSGSPEGVARADELLGPLGRKLPPTEADALQRKFQDEDDAASAGMGLFFTE